MDLLFLVAAGACALLLIALSLLLVPVRVLVTVGMTGEGPASVMLQASWGIIGARARKEGPGTRVEYLLLGRPVHTRRAVDQKMPAGPGPEETRPVLLMLAVWLIGVLALNRALQAL